MFLVLLNYLKPISEIEKAVVEHRAFLQRYYDTNELICSGPQIPRTGGVILSRCESKERLEKIISEDPFKIQNLAEYQN